VSRKEATTRRGCDDMRMKKTGIAIIVLLCIASSVTYAWFTAGEAKENRFDMGTVNVEILEEFEPIVGVMADVDYEKVVTVKSNGSKKSYVRVKIFPEWSEPSLPASNVQFNLAQNSDWVLHSDGYYYFKYYLLQGQVTSALLNSISLTDLGPEYAGKTLNVKVLAEGVQTTHDAWKEVWGLTELPFEPDAPWHPNP